jgi:elongation factor Ts
MFKKENAAMLEGKPENIIPGIIQGAINKKLAEITLLEQAFVKDGSKKVKDLLGGATPTVDLFVVGEGIEKKIDNLAEEVAKTLAE